MKTKKLDLRSVVPAATLLFSVVASGCEPVDFGGGNFLCNDPVDVPTVMCDAAGSASVMPPDGFALPATVTQVSGINCLAGDGTCSNGSQFFFQSDTLLNGESFNFGINLPPGQGPGTYALGNDRMSPWAYGNLSRSNPANDYRDYYYSGLQVRSGTLVVTRNNSSGLRATFDLELETENGEHVISVTRGRVDLSDCGVRTVSTCDGY